MTGDLASREQTEKRTGMRRLAWMLPLVLVLTICLTFAASAYFARTTPVIANFAKSETERVKAVDGVYFYSAGYVDDADFLMLGQIPHDDYSRGGVYFIGDSKMIVSLLPYLMTPEERRLIHNYSIGGLRHDEERDLFRMLVEECGLLRAGGKNTTIFIDVSYYRARPKTGAVRLSYYVQRHGLYTYKPGEGMHVAPIPPIERFINFQRDYAQRFLEIVFHLRQSAVIGQAPENKTKASRVLGDTWRAEMTKQVGELTALIDYLQSRGVHVVAIYPPSGSWDDEMPYAPTYYGLVGPILKARGVPIMDQGDTFTDSDFADAAHLKYSAAVREHEANLAAARRALADMGVTLPPSTPPAKGE